MVLRVLAGRGLSGDDARSARRRAQQDESNCYGRRPAPRHDGSWGLLGGHGPKTQPDRDGLTGSFLNTPHVLDARAVV